MASAELAPSHGVSAWGEGTYGQLGDGSNSNSRLPVPVTGLSEVTAVAGGSSFALALLSNGTVMAWGHNAVGELGDGSTTESTVPVTVSGLSGVTAIAAGQTDGYALLSNGTVMAWGENNVGQLGTGSMSGPEKCVEGYLTCSTRPVAVRGLTGVTSLAGGEGFALALLSNGTVMAWGGGERGKLGDGSTSNSAAPVAVQGLTGVAAIAAGYDGMALLSNGSVRDWGFNAGGELGTGSMTGPESCGGGGCSTVPVAVSGLSGVSAIASGGSHDLALLGNGTVKAWGYNGEGMLGNGTEANSDLPTEVSGLSEATAIAAGSYHSMALLSNGTVKSWGWDVEWELGNAEVEGKSAVPIPVSYLSGVQSIAAGGYDGYAAGPASPPVPTVIEVEPNHGPPSGGTTVTVTGTNFTGATAVHFGSTAAEGFAVNSATSITAVSPAGAGAVDVTVTTPEGTSPATVHDWFVYGPPTVTKVEPGSGGLSGGTSVTITGTNLEAATEVTFGSTPASYYHVNSNSSITATAPSGQGTVDVTVSTYAGTSATSAADRFTYARTACEEEVQNAVPVVTGVTPASGPEAGGTTVRVTGERFYQVQGCVVEPSVERVLFGGREASSVRVESEGALTAVAPPGSGTVDVTVETNAASQTSAADRYNYIHTVPPQVSGITPSAGSPAGGTAVTITGSGFSGVSAVHFGSAAATSYAVGSETSITAVSPPGVGDVDVTVTTANGTSATGPADRFNYGPSVVAVEPNRGSDEGGRLVTIRGENLTGATAVHFGSASAAAFTVNSSRSLSAVSPAGSGTVDVTVTTPNGTSPTSSADEFTYFGLGCAEGSNPVITSVEPGSGYGGETVTIRGRRFFDVVCGDIAESVYKVLFGAVEAGILKSSKSEGESSITVAAPPGSGTVNITLEDTGGATSGVSFPPRFTYLPPSVTAVSPSSGEEHGGKAVTITGTGFTGATAVKFGTNNATSFTVESETAIRAVSPAGKGDVDVTVTGAAGTSATSSADRFSYDGPSTCTPLETEAPAITSVQPSGGAEGGGTAVTITGQHFTALGPCEPPSGAILVYNVRKVWFGATEARFKEEGEHVIKAVAPAGTGTVDITVESQVAASARGSADRYTYFPEPSVTKVEPGSGPAAGGTPVTITGANFTGATAVQFEGTPATSFKVESASRIIAVAPPGTGEAFVTVTTPGGRSETNLEALYVYDSMSISSASLPEGEAGSPYSQTLEATGGKAPYRWSVTGGALPSGLSLSNSGAITGTPGATGTATFTVQAKDSGTPTAQSATATLSISVAGGLRTGHPELFSNGFRVAGEGQPVAQVLYGDLAIKSSGLPVGELECVSLGLASAWNGGSPARAHGRILSWSAAGHAANVAHKETGAECRGGAGGGFVTDEGPLTSVSGGEATRGDPTVPWNTEALCGERETEHTTIIKIGVPNGAGEATGACISEAAETSEADRELANREGCYASDPAPQGCIGLVAVFPALGLELGFGGTLRVRVVNGAGNGLNQSRLAFQGAASGELQCEAPAGCSASATAAGEVKVQGYEAVQLIQER